MFFFFNKMFKKEKYTMEIYNNKKHPQSLEILWKETRVLSKSNNNRLLKWMN